MTANQTFIERLAGLAGDVPDAAVVVALKEQHEVRERGLAVAHSLGDSLGWKASDRYRHDRKATTVLRDPDRGRMTVFHDSGAVAVRSNTAPFDELFEKDPGDEALTEQVREQFRRFSLEDLLSDAEQLDFERLWRIRAAGSNADGAISDPVLCRAVGAFRHRVHGLPVLGRASAHVELTGADRVSAASVSLRGPADGGSEVLAEARVRAPLDAASEVAARVARLVGGRELGDEVTSETFSFGYLSLGRRRAQSVLAPYYVAAVSIGGGRGRTKSAHVVPVAATDERFLSLPRGAASGSFGRKPHPSSVVA